MDIDSSWIRIAGETYNQMAEKTNTVLFIAFFNEWIMPFYNHNNPHLF